MTYSSINLLFVSCQFLKKIDDASKPTWGTFPGNHSYITKTSQVLSGIYAIRNWILIDNIHKKNFLYSYELFS